MEQFSHPAFKPNPSAKAGNAFLIDWSLNACITVHSDVTSCDPTQYADAIKHTGVSAMNWVYTFLRILETTRGLFKAESAEAFRLSSEYHTGS